MGESMSVCGSRMHDRRAILHGENGLSPLNIVQEPLDGCGEQFNRNADERIAF